MSDVAVRCERGRADGWRCTVTLAQAGRHVSTHRVSVSAEDLDRLTPGAPDPTDLIERSFAFLLEREPPGSILSSFDLPLIGRYFPEYESTIRDRGERG